MNEEEIVLTPMMKQFLDLKAKHPDAVMLFLCGDFYETYSTDAIVEMCIRDRWSHFVLVFQVH